MATTLPWNPSLSGNLLLIGNSIVQGGNPLDQKNRLGAVLQNAVGSRFYVWPIAAGGWSNVNEISYLEQHANIAERSDLFVWEYMAGGLSELSRPRSEYITPTSRPWFASWYVARRYILPRYFDFGESELPPTGKVKPENLARFEAMISNLATRGGAGIIFLYPERTRLQLVREGKEWLPERTQIQAMAEKHGVLIIDIARRAEWNESLYRDDAHLTAQGNQVLGGILMESVQAVSINRIACAFTGIGCEQAWVH